MDQDTTPDREILQITIIEVDKIIAIKEEYLQTHAVEAEHLTILLTLVPDLRQIAVVQVDIHQDQQPGPEVVHLVAAEVEGIHLHLPEAEVLTLDTLEAALHPAVAVIVLVEVDLEVVVVVVEAVEAEEEVDKITPKNMIIKELSS